MPAADMVVHVRAAPRVGEAYILFLSGVLFGYAILGKGFAYLGAPPLYIGEIALALGISVLLRIGRTSVLFTTSPAVLLAVTTIWVALRTIPFLGIYGLNALRDSVVVVYGGFAFVMIALLLDDARRIDAFLHYYGIFVRVYVPVVPFLFGFEKYFGTSIPVIPLTGMPLYELRPGEVAVHMTGAVVFTMAGFRRSGRMWGWMAFVPMVMVGSLSRGPMLAEVIPVTFAAMALGMTGRMLRLAMAGLVVFGIAYVLEPVFSDFSRASSSSDRSISTRQLVDNVTSIVARGDEETESTKLWRLQWWDMIFADTLYGPHFWTGRGFGLNLADADGFQAHEAKKLPPLRSPHSVHMTMLARAGVPGFVLWELLTASWFALVLGTMYQARIHGETAWAGALLFAVCYVMSVLINASFDVALEGPMLGIWYWCLIGFGIGTVMAYQARHQVQP